MRQRPGDTDRRPVYFGAPLRKKMIDVFKKVYVIA